MSHHTLCGLFFHLLRLFHHVDFYSARLFRSRQFGHGTTTQAQVPNRLHCTQMLRRFLFFNKPLHWSFLFVYKSDICFLVNFSCLFFYYTRALLLCSYSQNLQRFPRSSCLLAQRLFIHGKTVALKMQLLRQNKRLRLEKKECRLRRILWKT